MAARLIAAIWCRRETWVLSYRSTASLWQTLAIGLPHGHGHSSAECWHARQGISCAFGHMIALRVGLELHESLLCAPVPLYVCMGVCMCVHDADRLILTG